MVKPNKKSTVPLSPVIRPAAESNRSGASRRRSVARTVAGVGLSVAAAVGTGAYLGESQGKNDSYMQTPAAATAFGESHQPDTVDRPSVCEPHVVVEGDTAWDLAQAYAEERGAVDTDAIIDRIEAQEPEGLHPGDTITIC